MSMCGGLILPWVCTFMNALGGVPQAGTVDVDKILERAQVLIEEAKASYETAKAANSVQAFLDADFKLEEARIKCIVVQEIGTPEKQKVASDRLRAIQQLSKLVHDGRVAISGKPAEPPAPKPAPAPADPAAAPSTPPEPSAPVPAPALPPPVEVGKRAAAPDPDKQKDAEKLLRDLFKAQYAKKDPSDRRALARAILAETSKNQDDPVSLWVLCREAQDIAIQSGDVATALSAVELVSRTFDVDGLALRGSALQALAKSVKASEEMAATAVGLDQWVDDLVRSDQFEAAEKASALALQLAKKANAPALVPRLTAKAKDMTEAKASYQGMKRVLETLARNPEDPGANLETGRFLCFVKGSWDLGLRFLVKSSDGVLKPLAQRELSLPSQAMELSAIAESWNDLGDKEKSPLRKAQILAHAKELYEASLASAQGLLRSKIEKRLEALKGAAPSTAPTGPVDLLKLIDASKDSVVGDWTCDGKVLACTRAVEKARLQIPYVPPDEYDLTLVVERKDAPEALSIGLAKGNAQWMVVLDGWAGTASGISTVDGRTADDNETTYKGKVLTTKRASTIQCSVRKGGLTVTVDGKKVVDYRGGYERLANLPALAVPNGRALFVGCYSSAHSFSKLQLTPVSGSGSPTR